LFVVANKQDFKIFFISFLISGWTMIGNVSFTQENGRYNKYLGIVGSSNISRIAEKCTSGSYILTEENVFKLHRGPNEML